MPLYEFVCKNKDCQVNLFEESIKLKDLETTTVHCPKCSVKATKIVSLLKTKHASWTTWRMGHGS